MRRFLFALLVLALTAVAPSTAAGPHPWPPDPAEPPADLVLAVPAAWGEGPLLAARAWSGPAGIVWWGARHVLIERVYLPALHTQDEPNE